MAITSGTQSHERQLDDFRRILKDHLPSMAASYKVKSLGVFGSFVRDEQGEDSDLDVLVEFVEAPDIFQFMELEQYLSDLLQHKVDLVSRNALRGRIGERITREVIPI
jgi:uncharacterized protein